MFKKSIALTTGATLLAVPAAVLVAAPAHADVERSGACGTGHYDFSVDREGRGWEVGADLDNVRAGSKWQVVLKQDGKTYFNGIRTADYEGDLDVDAYRGNTAGADKFTMRIKRVGARTACGTSITV